MKQQQKNRINMHSTFYDFVAETNMFEHTLHFNLHKSTNVLNSFTEFYHAICLVFFIVHIHWPLYFKHPDNRFPI